MPNLEQTLGSAGLTEKEAKVYLAALELGSSTATPIARKAGVNRATTYLIADNLIARGLMTSLEKDSTRFFVAEPPAQLLSRLKAEQERMAEQKRVLESALPELESLVKAVGMRPRITYYRGIEGLEAMREFLYRHRHDEILNAVDLDSLSSVVPLENIRAHHKKLKLYDLHGRVLYTYAKPESVQHLGTRVLGEVNERRMLPREKFPFEGEVCIFGDNVAFLAYQDTVHGTIVEHAPFAKTMHSVFELAWNTARTLTA
jgi:DNA-binding MarR family transcriptional regulator